MSRTLRAYLERATELSEERVVFATITLVETEGHVPQDPGAKAIVTAKGLAWGTIGGGRLEATAIENAITMIARATQGQGQTIPPCLVRYELKRDLGMVCGGAASVLYEVSPGHHWNIVVFGAGHVAQATVPLLASFHCTITCIDPRQEWLDRFAERANVTRILTADVAAQVWKLPAEAFCLCMTQGHATDLPIVRELLKRNQAAFIGVIGSVRKAQTMRSTLIEEGFPMDRVSAIQCPLGLPIGGNDPAEIAVSIAAQLLQIRDRITTPSVTE